MPETLKENIKPVQFIPIQVLGAGVESGSYVDTKLSEMFSFVTALVNIEIGDITGVVKVKIEESDDPTFVDGTEAEAEGGEEITVLADKSYSMEIQRTKRYLRAVVTVGTSAEVFVGGILVNWQKPFPVL